MAVGESGRLVVEIDPSLKKELHQTLREDGTNLKDRLLIRIEGYLSDRSGQEELFSEEVLSVQDKNK